jgi:hypothetical protein
LGACGKRLEEGSHRAAAMADDGGLGGNACARGERPGRVYMGAGGRLGGRGVNHVAGARAAWAARRCDVRRPMACGGWHADEWKLATWHHPNARGRRPQWHSGAAHGPLGPPLPRCARAARVRPMAWHASATSRVGALWRSRAVGIPLNGFQNCFSPIFRTKLHLRV